MMLWFKHSLLTPSKTYQEMSAFWFAQRKELIMNILIFFDYYKIVKIPASQSIKKNPSISVLEISVIFTGGLE